MPNTYNYYLQHKNCACNTSDSFRYALYQVIEKADMANRKRIALAFPREVSEVLAYEGHRPLVLERVALIKAVAGIHEFDRPDELAEMMYEMYE